ncbi:MAG: hypothetical protein RMY36_020985 [Nostoc sp. SerVER01]|uniref:hypothetical protein n=1 Tax=Nostoc sp. CCY 9925 TaxID=3103865 RepID=UPI002AD89CE1|nr:hypothetical protein [Nostoc sp. SerVER01]MDZ8027561.1 hypothetical protein [Nostoc sp. DedQUE11]MDZ8077998.1 hypothetical protein [Nostoc sp. DcaGUA01]MDZ8241342.1 hypothetical protein [Nostoc sp. ChiQUE01a]
MKVIASVLSILRPVRFLVVAFTCALLLLSSAFPAFAISGSPSSPTEGETQLLDIQRETDKAAKEPPIGLKETQEKTQGGLNEVQGTADIDKQKRPENSQNATTVEEKAKNLLDKITGK